MRKRHSTGGINKQRGRWIGLWCSNGKRRSRSLGFVKDMSKTKAREIVGRIVAEERDKWQADKVWCFGDFVKHVYFPYHGRKWKDSTRKDNVNRISVHLVGGFR